MDKQEYKQKINEAWEDSGTSPLDMQVWHNYEQRLIKYEKRQ